jgi:hypothetical protein
MKILVVEDEELAVKTPEEFISIAEDAEIVGATDSIKL